MDSRLFNFVFQFQGRNDSIYDWKIDDGGVEQIQLSYY